MSGNILTGLWGSLNNLGRGAWDGTINRRSLVKNQTFKSKIILLQGTGKRPSHMFRSRGGIDHHWNQHRAWIPSRNNSRRYVRSNTGNRHRREWKCQTFSPDSPYLPRRTSSSWRHWTIWKCAMLEITFSIVRDDSTGHLINAAGMSQLGRKDM